jgi:hypothetical protein
MTKAQLIDFSNPYNCGRLRSIIEKRQKGKCHKCGEPLVSSAGIGSLQVATKDIIIIENVRQSST